MHSRPFKSRLHHDFVATLHAARANRPPLLVIAGVLHVRFALLQIRQFLGYPVHLGMRRLQAAHRLQDVCGSLVLSCMQLGAQPSGSQLHTRTAQDLFNGH